MEVEKEEVGTFGDRRKERSRTSQAPSQPSLQSLSQSAPVCRVQPRRAEAPAQHEPTESFFLPEILPYKASVRPQLGLQRQKFFT